MRKIVVTEIEILNQEEYDAIPYDERVPVGECFDCGYRPNMGKQRDTWVDLGCYKIKMVDQTDDEWQKIPREFKFTWTNSVHNTKHEELFYNEYDFHERMDEILKNENFEHPEVCGEIRQIDLTKETFNPGAWVFKEIK